MGWADLLVNLLPLSIIFITLPPEKFPSEPQFKCFFIQRRLKENWVKNRFTVN